MNTFLSPSQEAVKEQYDNFACEAVAPIARELESHKVCLKEFLQNAGQKGYLGMSVPKEYGGQGQSFLNCALFTEAVAQYEAGLGLTLANHYAVIETLNKYGSENQKSRYLPLLARGEIIATLAFSEAQAGTDVRAVQASLAGDAAKPVLNGKKSWVVTGDFAGLLLVLCKTDKTNQLAVVLVDANDQIKVGPHLEMFGLKSAYVNNLEFESTALSGEALLSTSAGAEAIADFALDASKIILAAAATGLTRSAIKAAVEHARKREQFGVAIGQFQGIQWKLADMETENCAAILQVYRAAWSLTEDVETLAKNAAMAKLFAARVARFHSGEALQILGASGLMEDNAMEKMYRDAKAMEICLGTSEAQKIKLAELLNI